MSYFKDKYQWINSGEDYSSNYNNILNNNKVVQEFPIGISFPFQKGKRQGETLFKMNFDIESQIKDNLKVLLLCRKNEKLRDPNFGTNLSAIFNSTNVSDEQLEKLIKNEIIEALSSYMSPTIINKTKYFINPVDFNTEKVNKDNMNSYVFTFFYRISGYSKEDIKIIEKLNKDKNIDNLFSKVNKVIINFRTSN